MTTCAKTRTVILLALAVLFATPGSAAVEIAPLAPPPVGLHPLFTDHAVLQRGMRVPIWGWAEPGSTVTVAFAGQRVEAVAGADRRWRVELAPLQPGDGDGSLRVTGGVQAQLQDVVVGDVWLCSGQSNMEMGIGAAKDGAAEIAAADHPQLRLFAVTKRIAIRPEATLDAARGWQRCSPESLGAMGRWGGFSAVAYTFGRHLQQRLAIPIGLIHSSWGGTRAEAWTSEEALGALAQHRDEVAVFAGTRAQLGTSDPAAFERAWWAQREPGSKPEASWWAEALDETAWRPVELPAHVERLGLPDYDGTFWFRREVEVPAELAGRDLVLRLGPIDDRDVTSFNGEEVGASDSWNHPRAYAVPGRLVRAGTNRIAIRVLDAGGPGGVCGKPDQLALAEAGGGRSIPLAGTWKLRAGARLQEIGGVPARLGGDPNATTVLYNGMIAPLTPCAIAGAIWYQGESNVWSPSRYRRLLPAMIGDWRARFGCGEFPFLIVQLAAFKERAAQPGESPWAELCEAQAQVAATVPRCGLAVTVDIGDAKDIHPVNKQEVGRRLGLAAERIAYGREVVHSGPVFRAMRVTDGRVRLSFDHADGLGVHGWLGPASAAPTGFAIAAADGPFVWAETAIKGQEVVVWSPTVPQPTRVRYAWADNPACDLVNGAGLPAVPFRTDAPPAP